MLMMNGCVGAEQARADGPLEVISGGGGGPLLIESLNRRRIGRTVVTRR